MCTWAYAWVSVRLDNYIPLIFMAAIIADAAMVHAAFEALGRACK